MSLNVYLLTFNCGRSLIHLDIFAQFLLSALPNRDAPEILVLNLQEIAPISYAFLGGSFLQGYFDAFRLAVRLARSDTRYVQAITRNVGMTAIMVFVRDDVASNIVQLRSAGVGVGFHNMGNKGAVGVRLGYKTEDGVLSLTFVSAHLAPMEWNVSFRNEDYQKIASGLVFSQDQQVTLDDEAEDVPLLNTSGEDGSDGLYSPFSHLFVAGDLNYRTSDRAPTLEDATQSFPQPTDDVQDPRHYSHLLTQDQLTQQLREGKTLHGLTEAPIDFPPTYKYHQNPVRQVIDNDDQPWNWATHRWPSWCDRILYLDVPASMAPAGIHVQRYKALPIFNTSDHRPVALSVSIPLHPINPSSVSDDDVRHRPPYALDPNWKAKRDLARRKEIVVGLLAYFTTTYEGFGLLAASTFGILGGWYIVRSMLEG